MHNKIYVIKRLIILFVVKDKELYIIFEFLNSFIFIY